MAWDDRSLQGLKALLPDCRVIGYVWSDVSYLSLASLLM